MIYVGTWFTRALFCAIGLLFLAQEPEQPGAESMPPPLFGERTEDQVAEMLANAPPGEDDGTRAGLKVYVAERFSVSHQLAYLIGACACLGLMLPGAFLIVAAVQGKLLSPERVTQAAITLGLLSIAWVMIVYSLAFSRNAHSYDVQQREIQVLDRAAAPGNLFIGDLNHWRMQGLLSEWGAGVVRHPQRRAGDSFPHSVFMLFQMMFYLQAIAPLLAISHSRLNSWGAFPMWLLWSVIVYAPLCYWTRGGGWLADCVDTGGAVLMYIAIGFTALGLSFLRDRTASTKTSDRGTFQPGVLLYLGGAMVLAGCRSTATAPWPTFDLLNEFLGGVVGMLVWCLVAQRSQRVSANDWPLGFIAGMATVASGCASMPPTSAIIAAVVGALGCCLAIDIRKGEPLVHWTLFCVFGVSGWIGMVLTGVFASPEIAGVDIAGKPIVGVIAGSTDLFRVQLLTAAITGALAFVGGLVLPRIAIVIGVALKWLVGREAAGASLRESEATLNV